MVVDGKDFGEEVRGVDQAGEEDKAEKVFIDLDFFGRIEEVARPIAHSLSTKRREVTVGGGQGW